MYQFGEFAGKEMALCTRYYAARRERRRGADVVQRLRGLCTGLRAKKFIVRSGGIADHDRACARCAESGRRSLSHCCVLFFSLFSAVLEKSRWPLHNAVGRLPYRYRNSVTPVAPFRAHGASVAFVFLPSRFSSLRSPAFLALGKHCADLPSASPARSFLFLWLTLISARETCVRSHVFSSSKCASASVDSWRFDAFDERCDDFGCSKNGKN